MLPTLRTARLILRPATAADVDVLWSLWTDVDVRRFLWDDVEIGREQAASVLSEWDAQAEAGLGGWVIHSADGEFIGCAALAAVGLVAQFESQLTGGIEALIALAPRAWHRGYGTEALDAVIDYAFAALGPEALVAAVDVPNEASHRLMLRVGFEVIGESDGPRYRLRSYRLTRDRHAARRGDSGAAATPCGS